MTHGHVIFLHLRDLSHVTSCILESADAHEEYPGESDLRPRWSVLGEREGRHVSPGATGNLYRHPVSLHLLQLRLRSQEVCPIRAIPFSKLYILISTELTFTKSCDWNIRVFVELP